MLSLFNKKRGSCYKLYLKYFAASSHDRLSTTCVWSKQINILENLLHSRNQVSKISHTVRLFRGLPRSLFICDTHFIDSWKLGCYLFQEGFCSFEWKTKKANYPWKPEKQQQVIDGLYNWCFSNTEPMSILAVFDFFMHITGVVKKKSRALS